MVESGADGVEVGAYSRQVEEGVEFVAFGVGLRDEGDLRSGCGEDEVCKEETGEETPHLQHGERFVEDLGTKGNIVWSAAVV